MEDRAENPDLRIAEKTKWRLVEGKMNSKKKVGDDSFFRSKNDGVLFVCSAPRIEEFPPCSNFEAGRSKSPHLRFSTSKIEEPSPVFVFRSRRSKKNHRRYSIPKIEESPNFDLRNEDCVEDRHRACDLECDVRRSNVICYVIFNLICFM